MSYQAFNNYVIAVPEQVESVSTSGIITSSKSANVYKIISTNEITKDLQDKRVVAKEIDQLDAQYFAIDYQKIVAIKDKD